MLIVDYETASEADLPALGGRLYAQHHTTRILMAGLWDTDSLTVEPYVREFVGPVERETQIASWGSFDYHIFTETEWRECRPGQWLDLMAVARFAGLPAGLDACAKFLGITTKKDPRGKALIRKYSLPQEDGSLKPLIEGSEDYQAMAEYCIQDVRLTARLAQFLKPVIPEWEEHGRPGYEVTERMNARGVPIDRVAAKRALQLCEEHEARLVEEFENLTGFKPSQVAKLAEYLGLENATKETLEAQEFVDFHKERARQIRLEFAKAATKKLRPMLESSVVDGRAHDCFIFNGAHTGRGASRKIQLQNMKRATVSPEVFSALHSPPGDGLPLALANPLQAAQENIRGFIHNPDRKLVVADYSQVEARIVAWLADCTPMLEAFSDPNRDIYREFAAQAYRASEDDVDSEQRTFGKIVVLGRGYGASPMAFVRQSKGYGVKLRLMTAQTLKKRYDELYPEVGELRDKLENAVTLAAQGLVADPIEVGPLKIWRSPSGSMLIIQLPSGRKLRYYAPRVVDGEIWVKTKNGNTRLWGGHILENVAQAIATDLKNNAMEWLDFLGIDLIMEVHDEIVAEAFEDYAESTLEQMIGAMERPPIWIIPGLIKSEGSVMDRYSK